MRGARFARLMEFRLLGPLELVDGGRMLELRARKHRALLAVLLLEANRVVSVQRLIDALWEDDPPETAPRVLQVYMSQLRKLVGRNRLETKRPGYVLRVEPDELDLSRFLRLQEEGRLNEALALWRGPPLAEFADQQFAQVEIARIEELRLGCLEQRIDRDLVDGRHADLVGELEALVREHPLRERLRRQLMLALYRSGRQAEALEAYRAARRALVDELGIEPGAQLRELHQAMLSQDPALDLAATAERVEREAPSTDPAPARHEVRKTITVLHADVPSGARLDPEALRIRNRRVAEEIDAALHGHGGSIRTTVGETVVGVFGVPIVHEDDAIRALRAAVEIRTRLSNLAPELRVGVATGEVVASGDEVDPSGEPFASAQAFARLAGAGEIALDEATLRRSRGLVTVESGEHAHRLVSVARERERDEVRFVSPLIGRERERRRLRDALETAIGDRSCQLFTVLGPAGVGKSRVVQEFLVELADRAQVARGRCLPYGEGITFWPLLEAVREAVGLEDSDTPDAARSKLVDVLAGRDDAELVATEVAEMIGLAKADAGAEGGFAAVRALFEELARKRSLTVVFDDIHWGETTFLDLVEDLADWTREASLLLVCLARPELLDLRPHWGGGKLNATTALLEPLTAEESAQLVDNLAGTAALPEPARRRIVETAEGNPLFVEEMYALIREAGLPGMELVLPATIEALLTARLDRLDEGERQVIEAGAVEGKVFNEGSVTALVEGSLRPAVHEHLLSLVRKELVRPDRPLFADDNTFHFRHLLIRDAAYDSIPKEVRGRWHEAHAGWLEQKAGKRAGEYEEILGYHLEQAYRYRAELGTIEQADVELARRAAIRLAVAGRRALARNDMPAALNLISRAISLLPPNDPSRVDLVPTVRIAQGLSGNLGWAFDVLDEAIAAGDDRLRAHALVQRGLLRLFTGADTTRDELVQVAEGAIGVFERYGDNLGLARAWRLVDQAEYAARSAGPSVVAAERAHTYARRAGDRFEEREIAQFLLTTLILGPTPATEGARRSEQLLKQAAGDPVLEVNALGAVAYFAAAQDRSEHAAELLDRARAHAAHLGSGFWVPPVYFALYALHADDPPTAEAALRPGYEALVQIGEKSNFSSLATLVAQAAYAQGWDDEAEELAEQARQAAQPIDVQCQTIWRTVQAKVLARRGALDRAEALAREAIAYVEESDFLPAHGEALTDLAHILRLASRTEEAQAAVDEAVMLFERKGDASAVRRCRAGRKGPPPSSVRGGGG